MRRDPEISIGVNLENEVVLKIELHDQRIVIGIPPKGAEELARQLTAKAGLARLLVGERGDEAN